MYSGVGQTQQSTIETFVGRHAGEIVERLSSLGDHVLLDEGRSFCGTLLHNKEAGVYACRLCGLPLFRSGAKFESGTGWPSFFDPIEASHVREISDRSHGMVRVEIRCRRCDGHLGHVFDDGPPPTHKRYCLNSVSLEFFADGHQPPQHTHGS